MRRLLGSLVLSAACLAGFGAPFSEAQSDPGPWTGEMGISETVAQIMKRPEQIGRGGSMGNDEFREGRLRQSRSAMPQDSGAQPSAATAAPKIAGPLLPQTTGTNFRAVTSAESPYIPPDSMGDVGPTQVLVCVNGRIKVFDRSGNVGALNTTTDSFFNSVRNNKSTSDPRVRYDRLTGRWFVIMINVANTNNRVVIAVSNSSTIIDTTSFTFFQFQQNSVAPTGDTGLFADYPTLGIDANALFIGCNMFGGNAFSGTTGFVVRKSSILGAGPIVATAFRQLGTSAVSGPYTPQGVDNDDPAATEGYFIGTDTISFGKLVMRRISNPGTTPTISATITVSGVASTVNPMGGVPCLGSTKPLDDLDDRLYSAKIKTYVDGGTTRTTLVCAHNIEVDASGVANVSGNRDGSRWYEIENLTGSPSIRQSGTLFDPAASNPDSYWLPSLAVSGQGHLALGCSVAGANRHAEIAVGGRLRGDPLHTLQNASTAVTSGFSYNLGTPNPQRWGDFSHTSVDPTDNMTMWTVQEYCDATNVWGVRVIQLKAPPPATPSGTASIQVGLASVPVIITGTSVSGSEFYDPGSAFPNRIAASVTGGVTVNSITFNSPTQVTLDLNTTGASTGAQDVTVTNPDGQSSTGVGILTLMPNTSPSCVVSSATSATNSSSITFTITFSAAVNGFVLADPVVTNGTKTLLSGGPSVYTLQATATAEGAVTCFVPAGAAQAAGDGAGNLASNTLGVTYDATAPQVLRVTSTNGNGNYGPTAGINVTVDFTEPVTLAGGSLQVTLGTGDVVTIAAFGPASSASGTYTVGAGDNSPDLNAVSPLILSAGTLRDAAGNNCALTIPAGQNLADLKNLVVDTIAPTAAIEQDPGQADPTNGSPILFTVVFSEPMMNFGNGDVTLSGTAGATTATVSGGPVTFQVSVSGMTGNGTVVATVGAGVATDLAGNQNLASTSVDNTVTRDVTVPTVTINQDAAQADPGKGPSILFTVVFSEPMKNFTTGDVTLSGTAGATTATVTGGPAAFQVSVTGMTGNGSVIATVVAGAATDLAGNLNAASTSTDNQVAYDGTVPTVTINQGSGQTDPTPTSPIVFDVLFSEAVLGFSPASVTLSGTAGATTATVSGSGPGYTVSVSGMVQTGTVIASIAAGAVADAAGNANAASTSTDNVVTFAIPAPTVTINQAAGQADPTNASPILYTVVFSEAVNGFTAGDVSFAGSTAGGPLAATLSVVTPGTAFTVSVTGMSSSGTVVPSIPAGAAISIATSLPNAASSSTDNSVTYDIIQPAVTINQAGGQDPTNASPILFTVVFSEVVAGFGNGSVSLSGSAGATTATVSGGPSTYQVSVSGMTGNGTVIASIAAGAAADLAGNTNTASTSTDNVVTYDTVAPTVTINQDLAQADPTNGSPIVFTVVFGEAVTNFTTGDVSFAGSTVGGTLAGTVTGSGASYSVSVTGMTGSGLVVASILAGKATDLAGNPNVASTSTDNQVAYDGVAPTVTINQTLGQADPTNGASISFTVAFSESVTGFATGDVSFASSTVGGTLVGTVAGSGSTYTVTVTGMAGTGLVVASIPAGKAADSAGNPNAASTSTDNQVAYDGVAPTVTINQAAGQADPTNGAPILFTVQFSESVAGFTTGKVTLSGTAGATTAAVSGGPAIYQVSVSGMTGDGTVIATIAAGVATDPAGNPNAASTSSDSTVTFDGAPPTVAINQAAGQADPTNGSPILFTVVFNEPVTGFAAGDVTLGGSAGATTAAVSGSGTTYTVSVSGMASDGTVTVSIAAGVAADAAGNSSLASTSTDNTVTYDTTGPVVTLVTSATPNGTYGLAAPIAVAVAFSEPVTVTGIPQLTLETGTTDAVVNYSSGTGTATLVFGYTVAAGHVSSDLDYASAAALALNGGAIRDAAGNTATLSLAAPGAPGSLAAGKDLIVDTTPPVAGTVNDGWTPPDVDAQLSVTTVSANWSGFSDPESGITGYEWAIGTTSGGQQILPFTPLGPQTSASTSAVDLVLALANGSTVYVTVRGTNGAGLTTTATSDGVTVTGTATGGPAAPAGFFAIAADQSVLLDWLASPGPSLAFYRIWWKPSAGSWTQALRVDPLSGLSTTISGLTNGTSYDFMIKAVDTLENESPGVFVTATPLASITIGGLGGYGTVQAALSSAVPGETVAVGPGTFTETLVLPPGVSLRGSSPRHTFLVGVAGAPVITVQGSYPATPTSTISNLTITTGTVGVDGGTADVLLDHVIIHHLTSHGASSAAAGRLRAVNCTIMSNGGDGIRAMGTAEARNCVVGKNVGTGLNVPAAAQLNYNDVYGNGAADYPAGAGGTGNKTVAAVFLDEAANDFIEDPGSTTVDDGDPLDAFSNELVPNGSRINQGAFGNTRWAASKSSAPAAPSGRKRGGGCGLLGLEVLAILMLLRRAR